MNSRFRRQLRARAHPLSPVIIVGAAGLSGGVLQEIDRALKSHELVKIRVAGADRPTRDRLLAEICSGAVAEPVQHIGGVLVIYRENPEKHAPAPVKDTQGSDRRGGSRTRPRASGAATRGRSSGTPRPGRRAR